jgi:hypothetical protein
MSALLSTNVLHLINQFGRTVTLTKPSYGAYDVATGTVSSTTNTDYSVKCFFADFNLSEVGQDNIYYGDRKAYLPTVDETGSPIPLPDAEDIITGVGDGAKVVRVQEIWSGETRICYICQVRA